MNRHALIAGFAVFLILAYFVLGQASLTGNVVSNQGPESGEIHEVYRLEFTQVLLMAGFIIALLWFYNSKLKQG